jgi:hypothetical protein
LAKYELYDSANKLITSGDKTSLVISGLLSRQVVPPNSYYVKRTSDGLKQYVPGFTALPILTDYFITVDGVVSNGKYETISISQTDFMTHINNADSFFATDGLLYAVQPADTVSKFVYYVSVYGQVTPVDLIQSSDGKTVYSKNLIVTGGVTPLKSVDATGAIVDATASFVTGSIKASSGMVYSCILPAGTGNVSFTWYGDGGTMLKQDKNTTTVAGGNFSFTAPDRTASLIVTMDADSGKYSNKHKVIKGATTDLITFTYAPKDIYENTEIISKQSLNITVDGVASDTDSVVHSLSQTDFLTMVKGVTA